MPMALPAVAAAAASYALTPIMISGLSIAAGSFGAVVVGGLIESDAINHLRTRSGWCGGALTTNPQVAYFACASGEKASGY